MGSDTIGPYDVDESRSTSNSGNETGDGVLKLEKETEEGEERLDSRATRVEKGIEDLIGDSGNSVESASGEKAPGIECRTGRGNVRGERGTTAGMGEGLSMGRSRGVELLVVASGS